MQIFIAYARKDSTYLDELRVHLKPLERSRKAKIWYDGKIGPGEVWEDSIKKHLHEADIILLMVSPDAIASDYFYEKEMADALRRHHEGSAIVMPFIIRPCAWRNNTPLGKLQALPKDGKAVTRWADRDHAFADAINTLEIEVEKRLAERKTQAEKQEQEQRNAEAAKRRQREAALAAEQERERHQRLQQEQAHLTELRRQTDAAKAQQREVARQRRKDQQQKVVARLRSPWAWGSGLTVLMVFLFVQMCDWPAGKPIITPPNPAKKRKSGFDLVKVKGGSYIMGSPENEGDRQNDECQHSVTVKDFQIGRYEVTQADWREVMGKFPPDLNFKGCDQCPVEGVSWNDVQVFLKKASTRYGVQYKLPTEEMWEYAARGGANSKGYKYAGSNSINEVAWYGSNSGKMTHPVGGKKDNELGLYDMCGNVWEWCADEWQSYPDCGNGLSYKNHRVVRGGSWDNLRRCRVAGRGRDYSSGRLNTLGFRLARY
ncbi:MAG: SUMF1/EgtB/PvdO family nonheme iron enzyme [Bacteroidota bacterium]